MASPVDTSVKHFSSLMTNAPVLNGVAGSLRALLLACGQDGFDIKTLTSLVVASGVATMTWTGGHSCDVDTVVLVAGVTGGPTGWAGLNGEQKVVTKATSGGSATFACPGVADGSATGTITIKMAPFGLSEAFTGTNLSALFFPDMAGTRMFLRLDDTAATIARVVGYESMSDVNTGGGSFPATAQISGGGYWGKSGLASATAVAWALFGDSRAFFLHVFPSTANNANYLMGQTRFFGDGIAARPGGDAYLCGLNYSVTSTPSSMVDGCADGQSVLQLATPRAYTGLGTSQLMSSVAYTGGTNSVSGMDSFLGAAPSGVDGSIRLSRRFFSPAVSGGSPRGDLPGLYTIPQSQAFDSLKFGSKYLGTGVYAGKRFFVLQPTSSTATGVPTNTTAGASLIDITGPWR